MADTEETRRTPVERDGRRERGESCRSRPIGSTDNTTGNWSIKTQKCRRACDKIKSWNLNGIKRIGAVTAGARVQIKNRKEINSSREKIRTDGELALVIDEATSVI